MALAVWQSTIVNRSGDVQPNAQVEVRLESSGALAAIYADRDGNTPLANPFNADENGFARFYAAGGAYKITASLGAFSQTFRHVAIGLLGEQDVATDDQFYYRRTDAEIDAGVTPVDFSYPPGDVRRYGAVGDGVTSDTDALQDALNSNYVVYIPKGRYKTGQLTSGIAKRIYGDTGLTSVLVADSGISYILRVTSDLCVVDLLGFEGAGSRTEDGIQIAGSVVTVSGCYFNAFNSCISQNNEVSEYIIDRCSFALSNYGFYNLGKGINGRIQFCRAVTCKSAVYIADSGATTPTEGVVIQGCLFYDCGDVPNNFAVIEINSADYTRILDCMVDGNHAWAVRLTDSRRCDIHGGYFAANFAPFPTSNIYINGNCDWLSIRGVRTEFAPYYGIQFAGGESLYTRGATVEGVVSLGNGASGGDMLIDSCTDIRVVGCLLGTSGAVSLGLSDTHRPSDATVVNCEFVSAPSINSGSCLIRGSDNKGFVTKNTGIAVIPNGNTSVTFAHGLSVLPGRQVVVTLANAQTYDALKWAVSGGDITVERADPTGDCTFGWHAEVI